MFHSFNEANYVDIDFNKQLIPKHAPAGAKLH